jgi:hypothetical protein
MVLKRSCNDKKNNVANQQLQAAVQMLVDLRDNGGKGGLLQ